MERSPKESAAPARLFVDSCAWLAFFSARDRLHAEADRLMRVAVEKRLPLLTSNLVVAEVHRLLLFRAGIAPARKAIEQMEASSLVVMKFADQKAHRAAQAWLSKLGDQVISYADATSFALMEASRCDVAFSFDSDFRIGGFSLWQDHA